MELPPPDTPQLIAAILFAIAVIHTFSARSFERLAHLQPRHAGLWHLLGEVETVFGFWAFVLLVFIKRSTIWAIAGGAAAGIIFYLLA